MASTLATARSCIVVYILGLCVSCCYGGVIIRGVVYKGEVCHHLNAEYEAAHKMVRKIDDLPLEPNVMNFIIENSVIPALRHIHFQMVTLFHDDSTHLEYKCSAHLLDKIKRAYRKARGGESHENQVTMTSVYEKAATMAYSMLALAQAGAAATADTKYFKYFDDNMMNVEGGVQHVLCGASLLIANASSSAWHDLNAKQPASPTSTAQLGLFPSASSRRRRFEAKKAYEIADCYIVILEELQSMLAAL